MKYVKRNETGVVWKKDETSVSNKGLKQFINELCIKNLSTYEGRERAAKIILNHKSNVPIYVNREVILFPTESIRNYSCIFINYNEVLTYKIMAKKSTLVVFYDLSEIEVNISYKKIHNQMNRVQTILETKNP